MEKGDEIYLIRDGQIYTYKTVSTQIVDPDNVEFLTKNTTKKMVTLMTCWPAGTTAKRLIVTGEIVE
jgi:sortase A